MKLRGSESGLWPVPAAFSSRLCRRSFFPYRADGDTRLTYPVESLTVNQIRDALAVWFRAAPLGPSARRQLLKEAAWNISYTRHHNSAAKTSHRKEALRTLDRRGLDLTQMRTCIGSNFAR